MRPSPLLSAAAATALLAAVAAPALGAPSPAPAKGIATTGVTLLSVAAGGHTVSAGTLELLSDMLGAEAVAKIVLTPLTADGTSYGQQTVTPDSSPVTATSLSTGSLTSALDGVLAVSSPVLDASASVVDNQPSVTAGATSLGGLSLLGLPVSIDGALETGSAVSRTAGADSGKTVTVEGLALPSIADLLAVLGLNLDVLPIEVLTELLDELDLVNDAVDDAQQKLDDAAAELQTQIDAAQAEVDAAAADLAAAADELAGAESDLAAAESDLATKTAALNDAKAALAAEQQKLDDANDDLTEATAALTTLLGGVTIDAYESMTAQQKTLLDPTGVIAAAYTTYQAAEASVAAATVAVTEATTDVANAQSLADAAAAAVNLLKNTVAALQTTIDGLQAVLDAALAALQDLLNQLQDEIAALLGAIKAVLDGTPLVSFDNLSIITEAAATSNTEGGQSAKIVGGEIRGLEVLGTDVLSNVLGTSSIDLLDLVGGTLTEVNALIAELNGTLSAVLSTVPQFPTLSIPAPQIGLLTKSSSTDIVDGFGVAETSVKGLSVTIPSVSIPTALALPGAENLPALDGITQVTGLLTSAPIKLDLATLSSQSKFAPAVTAAPGTGTPAAGTPGTGTPGTGTPGTTTPQLPRTGATQALAVLGVALMAGAIVARRRQVTEDLVG